MSSKNLEENVISNCLSILRKYSTLENFLSLEGTWFDRAFQHSLRQPYMKQPLYYWIQSDSPVLARLEENLEILLPLMKDNTCVKWRSNLTVERDSEFERIFEIFSEIELAGCLKRANIEGVEIDCFIEENGKELDLKATLVERDIFFEVKTLRNSLGETRCRRFFHELTKRLEGWLRKNVGFGVISIRPSISPYYFARNIVNEPQHLPNLWNLIHSNIQSLEDYSQEKVLSFYFNQNLGEFVSGIPGIGGYPKVEIALAWPSGLREVVSWSTELFRVTEGIEEIGDVLKKRVRQKFKGLKESEINRYQPLVAYVDIERLDHVIYNTEDKSEVEYKELISQAIAQASSRISVLILVHDFIEEGGTIRFKRWLCENPSAKFRLTKDERHRLEELFK